MTQNIHKHRILILDFGSQYTQLLARRVREIGVYCELWAWDVTEAQIREFNPSGIILSGGPESTTEGDSPRAPDYVFNAGVPVFGVCYGMQTMAMQLGGKVESSTEREFGYAQVEIKADSKMFHDIKDAVTAAGKPVLDVWMSHGDKVTAIPSDFVTVASTESCPFAIMANDEKRFYGVQFHPEVTHTRQGLRMLERFVLDICGCEALWTPATIIEDTVARLREQVGSDQVILGLSGGVDSSVTALLLHRAIGKNLTCVFVDNGLLRLNEGQQVMEMFGDQFGLNIVHVNAENRFLDALAGISDPEAKRKAIGRVFVEVFDEEAGKRKDVKWLAQGTIYPDVIESAASATGKAHVIKSHHNVGGLPEDMKLGLVEPLKELFKDEVRKIGLELGLPYDMLYRHPFPGPGLGVRVLGEVKKEYCDLLRRADAIFIEELHKAELYHKVSQAFTVFLPVRSVGVMGDGRKYDWVVSLRAVETIDFMTAHWAHLPYDFLGRVSNRIINEVNGISRVVYDISGKPPATIEWE
ncbi:glutamine-hydrolyzing GMP synthase [Enterobacillus tribolii]|uniref:GMP synthase [glutamine-hydrolyzing] n=1 Tax=Enterobacillus tribolii TaxID=1487935 RepID=A0A370QNA5_9GAMM|nr:glutamine-hydrolyzing GMP synthase [Enterobacillus tribolii]MBW7982131.1 glutamine-hydrolyzing GMP synthase [Enterobacillus tribolii]RDK89847.1 GMP synthase (glutamine-hydrolysing) [Enterobacillus tribolii]